MTEIVSVHVFAEQATPATATQISERLQHSDDRSDQQKVYVFYSHPSVYVAHGLAQGKTAADLGKTWLDGIHQALEAQRKNRRAVRLLCLQDALEHPQALAEQTPLNSDDLAAFNVSPEPLTLMAGHQLVLQNDAIMAIIERLEASTLQLSEQAYHLAVDAESVLKQAKQTAANAASAGKELEQLKEKHELTLKYAEQNEQELTAERDEALERAASTSKELEQVKQERDQAVTRASGTSNELKEAKEENGLLLLQLQQVQEELEQNFIAKKETEQKLQQAQAKVEDLKKLDEKNKAYQQRNSELESENKQLMEHIQQQKAENTKLSAHVSTATKELEQTKQQLSDKAKQLQEAKAEAIDPAKLKEAEEENELLLLQLQQVQEELENYFIKYQDSEKQRVKQQKDLENAKKRNRDINEKRMANEKKIDAKYKDKIATLKGENKKLLNQLMDTQAQLEAALADTVSKTELTQVRKERDDAVARASDASNDIAQLKKQRDQAVDRASVTSKALAEKEAEIAKLNQQLITLELQALNQQFSAANNPDNVEQNAEPVPEPVITATRDTVETETSAAPLKTEQPAKRALSSRIKNRLKLGKRKGNDKNAWIKEQAAQLQGSEYFDGAWYLQQYPDLQEADVNPAEHYLRFGGFESRDPSPKFNSAFYLEQNPDVAQEGVNPLLHFVLYGEAEGRLPKPQAKTTKK